MTTTAARTLSPFWRGWLNVWCASLVVSGLALAAGAFEATVAPTRIFFELVNGAATFGHDGQTRFVLGIMGGISVALGVLVYAVAEAASALQRAGLGDASRRVWGLAGLAIVGWCLVDSTVSVLTGYAANVGPNLLILASFLAPLLASGALRTQEPTPPG